MNKAKIIIAAHAILLILIIAAFLPALKSGDEGYKTKTVAVKPVQDNAMAKDVVIPAAAEVIEQQAPVVNVVEEKVTELSHAVASATEDIADTVVADVQKVVEPKAPLVTPARDELYSVIDGNKLDAHSYAGFKLFRNWCARCHGTYGQGMIGPNLADSLKLISKEQFFHTVENGKSGQIGSMPTWRKNIKVMEGRDKLYAYLKARSDGAIGVVKPKKQ